MQQHATITEATFIQDANQRVGPEAARTTDPQDVGVVFRRLFLSALWPPILLTGKCPM